MLSYVCIQDEKQARKMYLRKPVHRYTEKQRCAGVASYNETIFRLEYDLKKILLFKKNSWKIGKKIIYTKDLIRSCHTEPSLPKEQHCMNY